MPLQPAFAVGCAAISGTTFDFGIWLVGMVDQVHQRQEARPPAATSLHHSKWPGKHLQVKQSHNIDERCQAGGSRVQMRTHEANHVLEILQRDTVYNTGAATAVVCSVIDALSMVNPPLCFLHLGMAAAFSSKFYKRERSADHLPAADAAASEDARR